MGKGLESNVYEGQLSQELGSVILMGPLQLAMFSQFGGYSSMTSCINVIILNCYLMVITYKEHSKTEL